MRCRCKRWRSLGTCPRTWTSLCCSSCRTPPPTMSSRCRMRRTEMRIAQLLFRAAHARALTPVFFTFCLQDKDSKVTSASNDGESTTVESSQCHPTRRRSLSSVTTSAGTTKTLSSASSSATSSSKLPRSAAWHCNLFEGLSASHTRRVTGSAQSCGKRDAALLSCTHRPWQHCLLHRQRAGACPFKKPSPRRHLCSNPNLTPVVTPQGLPVDAALQRGLKVGIQPRINSTHDSKLTRCHQDACLAFMGQEAASGLQVLPPAPPSPGTQPQTRVV